MTVRATFTVSGITDRGPNLPKVVMFSAQYDSTIPQGARLQQNAATGVISVQTDNPALLSQVFIGAQFTLDLTPASTPPALTPPPPAPTSLIAVADWPTTLLQVGNYFVDDDVWNAVGLTRGTFTDVNGTTYEQHIGVSQSVGPNGEVAARFKWGFPTGTTEIKSYPSIIAGNKPGWQNSGATPGGFTVRLPDGSTSTAAPSGGTPNTFFPLALSSLSSLKMAYAYAHNATPTGRGHLAVDIWLQNQAAQGHGFAAPPITTEIMVALTNWGGYGGYPNRNPSWYIRDVTIGGILWHVYYAPQFNNAWVFVVFEKDDNSPPPASGTLDLAPLINYAVSQGWTAAGINLGAGVTSTAATHVVSVELGVEPMDGTGDLTLSGYRVYQ